MSSVPPPQRTGLEIVPHPGQIVVYEQNSEWQGRGSTGTRDPYKFDNYKKAMYVELIRRRVRRVKAAEMVGVSYETVMDHFKRFPGFLRDVSEAEMCVLDEVEESLYANAIEGRNVVAQQVVLFNRRPDEWSDQRMMRAKIEAAAAAEEAKSARAAENALGGLREKLGELRSRLTEDDEPPDVAAATEGERVPVEVVVDDDEFDPDYLVDDSRDEADWDVEHGRVHVLPDIDEDGEEVE
jgi:hypothetical protein